MSSWHSYSKIFNVGHGALAELFADEVTIEEKVDGSQFSFGIFDGELRCRSKGQQLVVDAPEKLFIKAVETVKALAPLLKNGYTYRGEYLAKPKHNALAYDRHPVKHIIIFDISPGEETYLTYEEKQAEATRLGLETVPLVYKGTITNADQVLELMNQISVLGGQQIEGLVIKNYKKFGSDKKILLGKHVSEAFKEVHKKDWKTSNPVSKDVVSLIGEQYKSKARWNKAIQHLKERGELEGTPKDIGKLMVEIQEDIKTECVEEIKEQLYKWAAPNIMRIAIQGLPQWYKDELVKKQFEGTNE